MQPVGIPLSEFKTIHKLLSILINILDSMYHIEYLVINLIVSIAHMVLFEKFRILHRDVSINNTMIYIADVPESKGNKSFDDDGPKHQQTSHFIPVFQMSQTLPDFSHTWFQSSRLSRLSRLSS